MPWPQTGASQYHAQLGLPDKGRAIKELVVCNDWDLEPLDLLNSLALGCNQPSPVGYESYMEKANNTISLNFRCDLNMKLLVFFICVSITIAFIQAAEEKHDVKVRFRNS